MPRIQPVNPRYRRIYHALSGPDLAVSENSGLSLEDLGLANAEASREDLVFGTYSPEGLERALRAYGLFQRVEERVGPLELRVRCTDPFRPRITFWSRRYYAPVADLELRRTTGAEVGLGDALAATPLLYLDSLLLQNPGRAFDWHRPPLPGQNHPGLKLARHILDVLLLMARRIGAEALALTPSTFASACVYDRRFLFVDGAAQGRFLALRQAGQHLPRWLHAWAVELRCMRDEQGQTAAFKPSPMLSPQTARLGQYFDATAWDDALQLEARRQLTLDVEALQGGFPWKRMPPGPPPGRVAELLGYDPLAPVVAH